MRIETTKTEEEARRLHVSAWIVLASGLLLTLIAWWQATAPDGAPFQPSGTAWLLGGTATSVLLWWFMRHSAQRHQDHARQADALHQQVVDSEARLRTVLDHTDEGIITM